jgi:bacillithiol biosynthesis cysteine-adding enzyme BshC
VRDYLAGEGEARAFYQGAPFALASYAAKWEEVRRRFGREERERAALALRPTSPRAQERLQRFVREGGAVVTTGQQAGLLTGPVYTIHKALSVARLADTLEREMGILVLPVFWTASEDHDWAEVNHAYLFGGGHELRRVELRSPDPTPLPMSHRQLGSELNRFLDEAAEAIGDGVFAGDVMKWIRGACRPERTVAEAFSGMLAELLAPFDVLLTDAADPHLKQASAPVLRRALEEAGPHAALLGERTSRLEEQGYHAQVAVLEEATNVFRFGSGGRERIDRHPEGFVLHESRRVIPAAELLAELDAEPGRFSPNVLLRPVVESAVFPTLAYVGGPAEISYFAQLNALFPEFGMEPPVAFPRFSVTLVEPAVRRVLDRLALEEADLARPRHELATRLARDAMPAEVRASLDALGGSLADGYRRLIERASAIDPTLEGALGSLRNESLARLAESEHRIVKRLKDREADTLAQLDRVRARLRPQGEPQERVLNVVPFLARYGPDLLRRIFEEMRIPLTGAGAARAGAVPETTP